jgi:uncharacterized membrane protein YhaH (DUF805 family)
MGFGQAIASGFSNYVNFSGRACRSEFWFWRLFYVLATVGVLIIEGIVRVNALVGLLELGLFLPTLAISIRRLHDLDRSGWWYLLVLIPIVGWIILLIWYCTKGTDGPNRFGAGPACSCDHAGHIRLIGSTRAMTIQ